RPPVDMARPPVDMARPPVDMARPPVDMARPPVDMARPPVDQGVPDQGFVRGDARYGEPCECGADCRSGLCLRNPLNNLERQCTDVCDQVRCPGVDRCLHLAVPAVREGCADPGLGPVGTPLDVCVPNETGTPCANPEQCLFEGICVDPPNPVPRAVRTQPTCSAQCEGNQDCPSGFRCEAVRAADGQQIRICNAATEIAACPDGTNLTCGGVCPVPGGVDPLDISRCLLFENRAPGMCSCDCASAADCPVGFACVKEVFDFPDQAPGRPGVCLPIAGYTCPNGDDDCLSLFCAGQHPDEPFSRCTAPCLNRADCPANYECVQPPGLEFSICVANPPP
ncbi:MAG: hypothetical protein KC620_25520, partial [Myxococcales bacterium]|nr:hypothetical protein [Myxococcales bacterium]